MFQPHLKYTLKCFHTFTSRSRYFIKTLFHSRGRYFLGTILKKSLKIPQGQSESVYVFCHVHMLLFVWLTDNIHHSWIVPKKYLLLLDQTILLHFRSSINRPLNLPQSLGSNNYFASELSIEKKIKYSRQAAYSQSMGFAINISHAQ
jgi:hypothetical protein